MNLSIERDELIEVLEAIWETTMGTSIELAQEPVPPESTVVSVSLEVHGGWEGAFRMDCTDKVIRSAAARMFEIAPEAATLADVEDAAAELANIVGGNLLSLLPNDSRIGLPVVESAPIPDVVEELECAEPVHLNSHGGALTLRFTQVCDPLV